MRVSPLIVQLQAQELHHQQIQELLNKQRDLKMAMNETKSVLMIDGSTWSFDCKSSDSVTHSSGINLMILVWSLENKIFRHQMENVNCG